MKKHGNRATLRHVLALAALMLGATGLAACVAEPESTDSDEPAISADQGAEATPQAGGGGCCSEGTVTCLSNGFEIDYFVPNCGSPTRPTAVANCKAHCNNVACHDTGWQNVCD